MVSWAPAAPAKPAIATATGSTNRMIRIVSPPEIPCCSNVIGGSLVNQLSNLSFLRDTRLAVDLRAQVAVAQRLTRGGGRPRLPHCRGESQRPRGPRRRDHHCGANGFLQPPGRAAFGG